MTDTTDITLSRGAPSPFTLTRREWQWAALYCRMCDRMTMAAILVCNIGLEPEHVETLTIRLTAAEAEAVAEALERMPR